MSDPKWIFDEIAKGREDAYFRKKEAELLAELRRQAEARRGRAELAEELGVEDEAILKTLEDLGFSRDAVAVLHLVPLVQVAWSDGRVTEAERRKIREVAALRGIVPSSPGYETLDRLFDERPSDAAFDACWRVIRVMFEGWTDAERRTVAASLPAFATSVASVSGGLLGFRAISSEEGTVLKRIAQEFAEAHAEAARKVTLRGADAGEKLS